MDKGKDPTKTDQPQAIDNRAGDPRPVYDQYEVNQPQNMGRGHKRDREAEVANSFDESASEPGAE